MNDCRINSVRASWRKGLRRARSLPYNTHSECLPILCDALPVFDVLRTLCFMHNVRRTFVRRIFLLVIVIGLLLRAYIDMHSNMVVFSPLGRNALYCSLQYNFSIDNISGLKFYAGKLV